MLRFGRSLGFDAGGLIDDVVSWIVYDDEIHSMLISLLEHPGFKRTTSANVL